MGRTGRHLRPRPARPGAAAGPTAPRRQLGFNFDRSGYRVPAIMVSPWVAEGEVFNQEHRHTSLIATLREHWALGDPLTARDAAARTFPRLHPRHPPRPDTWATVTARPVPEWTMDLEVVGKALSTLGKGMAPALFARAQEVGVPLPAELTEPEPSCHPGASSASYGRSPGTSSPSSADRKRPGRLQSLYRRRSPAQPSQAGDGALPRRGQWQCYVGRAVGCSPPPPQPRRRLPKRTVEHASWRRRDVLRRRFVRRRSGPNGRWPRLACGSDCDRLATRRRPREFHWQVLRDLTDATPEDVAAERARVEHEGWGARLLALEDREGTLGQRRLLPRGLSGRGPRSALDGDDAHAADLAAPRTRPGIRVRPSVHRAGSREAAIRRPTGSGTSTVRWSRASTAGRSRPGRTSASTSPRSSNDPRRAARGRRLEL